jgi:hypothetical protein
MPINLQSQPSPPSARIGSNLHISLHSTLICFSASSRVVKALSPINTMVVSAGLVSTTLHYFFDESRTT